MFIELAKRQYDDASSDSDVPNQEQSHKQSGEYSGEESRQPESDTGDCVVLSREHIQELSGECSGDEFQPEVDTLL